MLAVVLLALAGCRGGGDRLAVSAASSLADVLPRLDPRAGHTFAASSTLAAQIRFGAPADVLVSADPGLARELAAEGLLERPRVLATNRLALLVPEGNPAGLRAPADLRRPGVRLVIAAEGVPLGDYTRALLARLGLSDLAGQAASQEPDARSAVARVALGEADAAIGYATDAAGAPVEALPLPAAAQPRIEYVIAAVAGSPRAAEARDYVRRALGPRGRAELRAAGFGTP